MGRTDQKGKRWGHRREILVFLRKILWGSKKEDGGCKEKIQGIWFITKIYD